MSRIPFSATRVGYALVPFSFATALLHGSVSCRESVLLADFNGYLFLCVGTLSLIAPKSPSRFRPLGLALLAMLIHSCFMH
jgi:hypothetical protein